MVSRFGIEPGRYGVSGQVNQGQYSIISRSIAENPGVTNAQLQRELTNVFGRGIRNENLVEVAHEIRGGLGRASDLRDALDIESISTSDLTETKMGLPNRYRAVVRYEGRNLETNTKEFRWLTLDSDSPFDELNLRDAMENTLDNIRGYVQVEVSDVNLMVIYDKGFVL